MEPMENSSLERETTNYKENESLSQKDDSKNTIGKKFCGVKDSNSDGSLSSGVKKHMKIMCCPNVPGKQAFLYILTV